MRHLLLIAALVTTAAHAQTMPSRIGQAMPPLHFEATLQGDPAVTFPRPGHPLVVEFWATWCPFCVANIAHLNALSDEFAGQGIDFLSLSNEMRATVEPFLAQHPMRGTVALDPGFNTNSGLQEPGLPFTVLLTADSHIAAAVHPDKVTPAVLTALLRNERLPLAALNLRSSAPGNSAVNMLGDKVPALDADAAVRVVVRPGIADATNAGFMMGGDSFFYANGAGLHRLLQAAANVSAAQIVLPAALDAPYSVQAWVPSLPGYSAKPLVLAALQATAGLTLHRETRPLRAFMLSGFPGKLTRSAKTMTSGGTNHPGEMDFDTADAAGLAETLSSVLAAPVTTDSPGTGWYSLKLTWDPADKDGLRKALATQGLTLHDETKPAEVLVFAPVEAASAKKK